MTYFGWVSRRFKSGSGSYTSNHTRINFGGEIEEGEKKKQKEIIALTVPGELLKRPIEVLRFVVMKTWTASHK